MPNAQNSDMIYDERMEAVARTAAEDSIEEARIEKIEIRMFNGEDPSE